MKYTIKVRGLTRADKSWLQAEARKAGISMAEFVRRLIRKQREEITRQQSVADIWLRCFGPEHGFELPPRGQYGYRPVEFPEDEFPLEGEK